MADTPNDKPGKEPYIAQSDRPEVRLKSDTPVSELTVRQLATILGQFGTRKDFWDGKDWQKDDFDGGNKWKDVKEFKESKEVKEIKEFKEKEKEFKEGKDKRENQGSEGREAGNRQRLRTAAARRSSHRPGDSRGVWPVSQGGPARRPGRATEEGQGLSPRQEVSMEHPEQLSRSLTADEIAELGPPPGGDVESPTTSLADPKARSTAEAHFPGVAPAAKAAADGDTGADPAPLKEK